MMRSLWISQVLEEAESSDETILVREASAKSRSKSKKKSKKSSSKDSSPGSDKDAKRLLKVCVVPVLLKHVPKFHSQHSEHVITVFLLLCQVNEKNRTKAIQGIAAVLIEWNVTITQVTTNC